MMSRVENLTTPGDFDPEDVEYARHLVDDGSMVLGMMTVAWWMNADGEFRWRLYNATAEPRLSESLGVLHMAQVDLMNRSGSWLPPRTTDDDD